jgi:hypothetical protein
VFPAARSTDASEARDLVRVLAGREDDREVGAFPGKSDAA